MYMVGHAADAIRLAAGVARDGGEIRMQSGTYLQVEERAALLRAKDDVNDDETQ
jgi:hypothetical protein